MLGCGRMGRFAAVAAVNLRSAGGGSCWLHFAHRTPQLESPVGCLLLGDKKATVSGGGDGDADAGGGPYNETFI